MGLWFVVKVNGCWVWGLVSLEYSMEASKESPSITLPYTTSETDLNLPRMMSRSVDICSYEGVNGIVRVDRDYRVVIPLLGNLFGGTDQLESSLLVFASREELELLNFLSFLRVAFSQSMVRCGPSSHDPDLLHLDQFRKEDFIDHRVFLRTASVQVALE